MGLIGSWLFCLCQGLPIAIFSPLAFLARPERWLWTIHQRRATLSAAPNFAYELCVAEDPRRGPRGPRPLVVALRPERSGAGEPRDPRALRAALRALRLPPRGLMPVYGLAESSVALCFPPVGRGPRVDRVSRKAFDGARPCRGRAGSATEPSGS